MVKKLLHTRYRVSDLEKTIHFAESSKYFYTDHFHFSEFYGDQVPPEAFEEFIDVNRHGGNVNYLFTDGHAEQLSWEQVKKRLENPKDRLTDPTR
jgi:prepilin-type processing-associated H-X9-DG protein